MSENPFEAITKACKSFCSSFQTHLSRIFPAPPVEFVGKPYAAAGSSRTSIFSFLKASNPRAVDGANLLKNPKEIVLERKNGAAPLTKEELGRATWTLLHTAAAQFPDTPTRQQKRDVRELMAILSRIYPCKECADHFKEVLKSNPVRAGSQAEFSQWLCHVHNIVNRRYGCRIQFPGNHRDAVEDPNRPIHPVMPELPEWIWIGRLDFIRRIGGRRVEREGQDMSH